MKRLKRAAPGLALAAMLLVGSFVSYGEDETEKVRAARSSVVRILVIEPGGISTGTGFGVGKEGEDAQTFITNWHVVTPEQGTYKDCEVYILLDDETFFEYRWEPVKTEEELDETSGLCVQADDGTWYKKKGKCSLGSVVECEVLYAEHQYPDVAVIKTKEPVRGVKTLPLKQVGQEAVGRKVYTIGYPGSADSMTTQRENPGTTDEVTHERIVGSVESVSVGGGDISRIIKLEDSEDTVGIVHHAHINHGNSGGPLLMGDGSAVGINTYGYGDMEYSVSIDIAYAMEILGQLGIEYTTASEDESGENPAPPSVPLIPMAAAALAVIVIVIVAAVTRKKKPSDGPVAGSAVSGQPSCSAVSLADLRLQGIKGVFAGRRFAMKEQLAVGRDADRCGLIYPAGTKGISGLHCVFCYQDGRLTVTDAGSTYGTAVNGRKLDSGTPCQISVGDCIFLGSDNEGFRITRKGGAV